MPTYVAEIENMRATRMGSAYVPDRISVGFTAG